MKLAFSGQARHTDFSDGYALYVKRSRNTATLLSFTEYKRVIRKYCAELAERLLHDGFVDLPCDMGLISAAQITRKPQYRGKRFVGYGAMDWKTGCYDGRLKAFGLVFLPPHNRNRNLRCFGFVGNRRLFQQMKALYKSGNCRWKPMRFDDEMI